MTKLRLALLLPLLSAALALCAAAWPATAFDPQTMMDVNEIQRGARAVGKTVFAGTEIVEFRLEIIDIMSKANLGSDMILARVLDGPVVARQSGIIGGMSGSPVYINGRLIGAVAWGWGFAKEPITGITPIRAMLGAMDMMDAPDTALAPTSNKWRASRPFTLDGARFTVAQVLHPGEQAGPGVLGLYPVGTPLNCNGMGPRTLEFAREKLARFGAIPCAGGGGTATAVPVDLVPGAAVGVRFMEGDFDMTGIGTVTFRKDDKLIAFGHPMMQLGNVNLPLSTAWINDFMPSYEHSNKMGAGMTNVGTLRADMPFAIGGQIGPTAPLIPAHIEIVDTIRKTTRDFNIRVMREHALTPVVLALGISSAFEAAYNPGRPGVVRTHFELKGEGGATIRRDNQFYMEGAPDRAAMGEVQEIMGLLEDNRWQPQGIAGISYRAEITERDETALIERVYVEENVAKAGKPIHIHVLLRPTGGPVQDEVFTLNMPLDLPKGSLRIAIGGGQDSMYFRSRLGLMVPDFDGLSPLLDYVEKLEQGKQLCVMAALPSSGLAFGTTRLMHLPASISAVLEKSSRSDLNHGKDELLVTRDYPYVVFGRELLSLTTEDRQGAKGAPASTTTPAATKPASDTPAKTPPDADDEAVLSTSAPTGLWWAVSALRPGAAELLRQQAAPFPAAAERPPKPTKATPALSDKKKSEEKKPEDSKTEEDDTDTAKAVVRQPSVWTQSKGSDFATGESKGTAVGSEGKVAVAPTTTELGNVDEFEVWGALVTAKGSYVATAGPARVYKLTDNKPKLLLDLSAFAARAMVADAAGNLYVGTWPGGAIYMITPEGTGSVFATLPCGYIWALAFDAQGRLLVGTGPSGQLYQIDPSGQATELAQLPQSHILSLLPAPDALYLGTADKGLVYKLLPDRQLLALLDTNGDDVTSLVSNDKGQIFAGTAPAGKVYRLEADKPAQTMFDEKSQPVYALAFAAGRLFAATGTEGKLVSLEGEGVYQTLHDTPATHVLCLAAGPDQTILGGTGNSGQVLRLAPAAAAEGTFTSSVFDAKRASRWGTLNWQATVPQGAELALQTRSGNSANPDDGSWSGWQAPLGAPGNQQVGSPVARYLQYRAQAKKPAGTDSPVLRRLAISYLPANQRPEVTIEDLDPNDLLRAEAELKWSASDPDDDQMLATLEYRAAGTTDWTLLKELAADEESWEWDTSKVTDGLYDLRVTISDEVSNPGAGLQQEAIAYGLRVDNAKPDLNLQKTEVQDGKLVIEGMASDNVGVAEIAYQVDEQWRGATPVDGAYDGQYEQFRLLVPLSKDGTAEVPIRVRDTAGNVKTETVTWPLETAKDKPKDEARPRK